MPEPVGQALEPVTRSSKPASRVWPVVAATVALLIAAWLFRPAPPKTPAVVVVPTARAIRGAAEATRRVAGSIIAGRFANIAAPVLRAPDQGRGLTLTFLATSGTHVKEGDVIAELDTADVVDHIDDVQADVAQSALDIKRRKAVYIAQLESLRQRLRVCKATLEKAKQDARAMEVKPSYQQEYLRLAVNEAQLEFDEVTKQIPLTDARQNADLMVYELSYQYQVRHLQHHMDDLRHCKVRSPMNGMVVMQTVYRGGEMNQIKVGDQLSPGQPFMRVVDPQSMQLDASMSQTESELVHLGQRATVRFDAFPDLVGHGHVASVGAMAYNGRRINYWVRQVRVRLALDDAGSRVIPDLTASADVIVSDPAEGLVVPREAVVEEEGKAIVYVKHEGTFAPQEVEIAGATNTQVAVSHGIQEGDEVALHPAAGRPGPAPEPF
jgi:multidrug efflux pump subunit AcrA (membrane-fusion protein)